jgi:hypothetical protein
MNIITTTAPIGLEDLKKYFNDKTVSYVIDYATSKLQGSKLLTYISNLDLPIDVKFDPTTEQGQDLLKAYMESTFLVSVPSLETTLIAYLFNYRFGSPVDPFVENNRELFDHWAKILDSCTIFNMYTLADEQFKEFARQLPEEKFEVFKGINFVQLLKHIDFFQFYQGIKQDNLKFMPEVFDNYMFKGKNLYSFWANENNPMFLLTWGVASSELTGSEYVEAKKASIAEMPNVTPF